MHLERDHALLFSGLALWVIAIGYGIASARLEISKNKSRFRTYSSILFASGLAAISIAVLVGAYKGQHYSVDGQIEQARVVGSGKSRRTETWVKPNSSSGLLVLHAAGGNPFFRPGERVSLVYQEYTGSILKARFFSASGKREGTYNNPVFLAPAACILVSLLIILGAMLQQRRDPQGAEQNHRPTSDLDGSVDTRSLLHLSSTPQGNSLPHED